MNIATRLIHGHTGASDLLVDLEELFPLREGKLIVSMRVDPENSANGTQAFYQCADRACGMAEVVAVRKPF